MIIVEKEGVVKQLSPFADEKGIALLNTRGFLTEYASNLSEQSRKNGCNIAILTDFDFWIVDSEKCSGCIQNRH